MRWCKLWGYLGNVLIVGDVTDNLHILGHHITIWVTIFPYGSPYHNIWFTILGHHVRPELTRTFLCQLLCSMLPGATTCWHFNFCFFTSLKSIVSQPLVWITPNTIISTLTGLKSSTHVGAGKPQSYDSPKLRKKSLGTGIKKIWYREKVSEPVLNKFDTGIDFHRQNLGILKIYYVYLYRYRYGIVTGTV